MAKFNKTADYTFAKLCSSFTSFEIPNFQRPYAWTNKNLQDFWGSIVENDEKYFIGNIVAVDASPLKIIDGQQRLTTILLLLCAIRDIYNELDINNKNDKLLVKQREREINKYLMWDDLNIVPQKTYKRLKLGKEMYQDIFDKIIDKNIKEIKLSDIGDNEKRILNNYKILKSLVKKHIKGSEISRLDIVKNKILNLQVITIVCDSDNDIYGIFEGFNSTGLGLSVADLVKNSILRASAESIDKQKKIESMWNELEELFEETSTSKFPKFLRYQWISENGYISMSNLYNEIKSKKIDKGKDNNSIKKYVGKLLDDGRLYVGMVYDKKSNFIILPKDIKKELFKFRYLRNEQVYEVLLSWVNLYKSKKFKSKLILKSLKKLWWFVVRAKFVSINPSDYEKIFSNHCRSVVDANNLEADIKLFFDKLKPLVNNKEQFVENLLSDVKYGRDNKIITKIFADLMLLDDPEIKQSEPTIEHILPQTPTEWGLNKEEIKDYVNKIGNLTLLFDSYNKAMSNKPMREKKRIFSQSKFKINKDIAERWSDKFSSDYRYAVLRRGEEIAERIEEIWNF